MNSFHASESETVLLIHVECDLVNEDGEIFKSQLGWDQWSLMLAPRGHQDKTLQMFVFLGPSTKIPQ